MAAVTILGTGDSWVSCPFVGEIWACATVLLIDGLKDNRYDKLFAFDPISNSGVSGSYGIALERHIPIVSTFSYATEKYPIADVLNDFHASYLANTISYMLALAIHQGRSPISLYGVEQEKGDYAVTKPFTTFWLGVATGRGLEYSVASMNMPNSLPHDILWEASSLRDRPSVLGNEWEVSQHMEEFVMPEGIMLAGMNEPLH